MPSTTPILPPIDDKPTILETLDFHVANNPDHAMYTYSESAEDKNITSISYLEFTHATHRIAHALRPNHQGSDGQVVGVIMLVDSLLYQATTVGLMRSGLIVSLP
jgi:acyl-coenzyme A synthetase/AMP-(fatty) acid ligase